MSPTSTPSSLTLTPIPMHEFFSPGGHSRRNERRMTRSLTRASSRKQSLPPSCSRVRLGQGAGQREAAAALLLDQRHVVRGRGGGGEQVAQFVHGEACVGRLARCFG